MIFHHMRNIRSSLSHTSIWNPISRNNQKKPTNPSFQTASHKKEPNPTPFVHFLNCSHEGVFHVDQLPPTFIIPPPPLSLSLNPPIHLSLSLKVERMQEEFGEGLLSLALGLGTTTWFSEGNNKRKRKECENDLDSGDDKLLQLRDFVGSLGISDSIDQPSPIICDNEVMTQHRENENLLQLIQTRDCMLQASPKRRRGSEDDKGLHLIHLLLMAATAVDDNNATLASETLRELYQSVSLNGDPIQRVTAYFADGLAARLLTRNSPLYSPIMEGPTPDEELSAFTKLYQASPYYQFAHFTANQAILEAFEEEEKRSLHVIDFDVSYGFQWPSLIQSLSDTATAADPISLRITGFGRTEEELKETEMQLACFANGCPNLAFEFQGLLRSSTKCSDIRSMRGATVVVNLVFHLHTLSTSLISETLKGIRLLKPSAVVVVEKEGNRSARSFLAGFMESLHYFAAMFDSLDDCLPTDSTERLRIEKNHLGREIKSVVADGDKGLRHERMETWNGRMERSGFEGVKMSSRSLSQAKLLLKIKSCCSNTEYGNSGGFKIFERDQGRAITLGWQDRHLVTASAWRCGR